PRLRRTLFSIYRRMDDGTFARIIADPIGPSLSRSRALWTYFRKDCDTEHEVNVGLRWDTGVRVERLSPPPALVAGNPRPRVFADPIGRCPGPGSLQQCS